MPSRFDELRQAAFRSGMPAAFLAKRVGRMAWQTAIRSPQTLFWRELVAQPGSVGAICASSSRLAARMAAHIDPHVPGLVVELGGGTGAITAAILCRGIAPERLVVIEQSAELAAHLKARFPQVRVVHGDAADLAQMQAAGVLAATVTEVLMPVQCIVSGLPLRSIPEPVRQRILHAGMRVLTVPHGRLLQFTYDLFGRSPWLDTDLRLQKSERVLCNLPPARIDVLTRDPCLPGTSGA